MDKTSFNQWEKRLQVTAKSFPYPPTPNITGSVRRQLAVRTTPAVRPVQQLTWTLALFLLILASLMVVPQVRAAVLQALRVGAIQIFFTEPIPTTTPIATGVPSGEGMIPASATATIPTRTALAPIVSSFGNPITLAEAQAKTSFTIQLPVYPSDLGLPDQVYWQYIDGEIVLLVWLEPEHPDRVKLSLIQIAGENSLLKKQVQLIEETSVNEVWAIWVEGPHHLHFTSGHIEKWVLVEGNVLIWTTQGVTYRLESGLSLDEAKGIAESLEPLELTYNSGE